MATSFWYPALVAVTCTMISACASDSPPDQRPAYSYEAVDIGPNTSGRQYRMVIQSFLQGFPAKGKT